MQRQQPHEIGARITAGAQYRDPDFREARHVALFGRNGTEAPTAGDMA
jgi:hypothetical protein